MTGEENSKPLFSPQKIGLDFFQILAMLHQMSFLVSASNSEHIKKGYKDGKSSLK